MLICQSSRDTRLKTVKSFHTVLIQCLRWWFGFHGPTINWSSTSATLQLDSILSCQLYGLYSFCLNKHRGKLIQTVSPVFGMEPLTDRMDGPPLWLFYISFQVQSEEAPENDQRWRWIYFCISGENHEIPKHSLICSLIMTQNNHCPVQCLVFISYHFIGVYSIHWKMVLSVRVAKDDLDAKQIHPHLSFPYCCKHLLMINERYALITSSSAVS